MAPNDSTGRSEPLWYTAALAAAGAAMAYALNRRRAREVALAEKRRRATRESSLAARQARLQRLWRQAQARVAPIRSGMLTAAAATITATLLITGTIIAIVIVPPLAGEIINKVQGLLNPLPSVP